MRRKPQKKDKGFTLTAALICLVLGSVLIAGAMQATINMTRITAMNVKATQAQYVAQTGAHMAISKVQAAFVAGEAIPTILSAGTEQHGYDVTIGPFEDSTVTYRIESTGHVDSARRIVTAYTQVISPPSEPPVTPPLGATPVPTPVPSDGFTICHKGYATMTLPSPSVEAHIRHGDVLGACP